MGNREEFLKGLKKGIAGALAGATVLAGATGCESKENNNLNENTPTITDSNMPIEQNPKEDLTNRLMNMQNKEEVLDFLKEMYINIDNIKNPENKLHKQNLEIYLKGPQTSCYYVESKDAIILKGLDETRTEQGLNETGLAFEKIGLDSGPINDNTMIIIANNGTTIDGVGSIPKSNIDEAVITIPERLSKVNAEGKSTAQEFPQQLLENIIGIANYYDDMKNKPSEAQFIKTAKMPVLCERVANAIYEYGLEDYIPEVSKTIEDEGR